MRRAGLVALALATSACELVSGGMVDSLVSEEPTPGLPQLDGTFADSFDDPGSGWPVATGDEASEAASEPTPAPTAGPSEVAPGTGARLAFEDGTYEVTLPAGRHLVPTAPVVYRSDQDVTVTVTARRVDKPGRRLGGVWGLACDAGEDQQYYFGAVQTTLGVGYAGIGKIADRRIRSLAPFGEPHETIDADGRNRFELRCTGPAEARRVQLRVNGDVVAQGTDRDARTEVRDVSAGVMIDTSSLPRGRPFVVRFDDFSLEEK